MPPPSSGASRWAALLGAAPILVWPALLNGYPLLFVDSASYLDHVTTWEIPWDKTTAYGAFLFVAVQAATLWWPVLLQGLILSALLWLAQRAVLGEARPLRHLLLAALLAALTSAPWFAAMVMPDVFTAIGPLALFLLGFGEHRLGRPIRVALIALAAFALMTHLSHLPTALALVGLTALLRRRWAPFLRTAAPLALALLQLVSVNWLAYGRPTLSAHGATFLLARLQDDGPALRTLRAHCPQSGWHLCAFLDRLPMDSDEFLWTPDSPANSNTDGTPRLFGSESLAPEARAIIALTLRERPLETATVMLANTLRQLVKTEVGDTFEAVDTTQYLRDFLAGFPTAERRAFVGSAQNEARLDARAAPYLLLHTPTLILAALLCLIALLRRPEPTRLALILCVFLAIAANAFVTGALSKPHHRYEARIIWLLPLAAILANWPRRAAAHPPGQDIPRRIPALTPPLARAPRPVPAKDTAPA